jgi:hypothetical protein
LPKSLRARVLLFQSAVWEKAALLSTDPSRDRRFSPDGRERERFKSEDCFDCKIVANMYENEPDLDPLVGTIRQEVLNLVNAGLQRRMII